ncbi:MAG TPA: 2-oxo acid dehydrogenase subunit E2 [Polyangiaceae bacterium]|nr:2-oxo acid dehydrogenase subunit E2 [Polyangiaceae bacterium]
MKGQRLTGWRKIAVALWDAPNDPQIFGILELDATPALAFIEQARASKHRVTATHLVARATARALAAVPDLNVRLLGDRVIPRESVDVFVITAVAQGHDLTGVKIASADRKSVYELADELGTRSARMKEGRDPDLARAKRTMEILPRPLLRVALRLGVWLAGTHGQHVPALGLDASPFGSAMVSSVGTLGLPMGFSPLAWMYTVPLLVCVGEIADKPVAVHGRVEVRPVLPITATIDHRYVDGSHLTRALAAFREYLASPASFDASTEISTAVDAAVSASS